MLTTTDESASSASSGAESQIHESASDQSCKELAASLSSAYRKTDAFEPSKADNKHKSIRNKTAKQDKGELTDYLKDHGILLTMCVPYDCAISMHADHMSASWVNANTGVQVILGTPLGLILDPDKVDITCIYPTDAATLDRDGKGCGPPRADAKHGSQGSDSFNFITRKIAQKAMTDFKNRNFGFETAWEEIDCQYFFLHTSSPNPGMRWSPLLWSTTKDDNQGDFVFQSVLSWASENFAALMEHPVCSIKNDDNQTGFFPLHYGWQSWDPMEWQSVMDLQMDFIHEQNKAAGIHTVRQWNEVVLDLPKETLGDVVSAVFLLETEELPFFLPRARDIAHWLGDKPVVKLEYGAFQHFHDYDSFDNDYDVVTCLQNEPGDDYEVPIDEYQMTNLPTTSHLALRSHGGIHHFPWLDPIQLGNDLAL